MVKIWISWYIHQITWWKALSSLWISTSVVTEDRPLLVKCLKSFSNQWHERKSTYFTNRSEEACGFIPVEFLTLPLKFQGSLCAPPLCYLSHWTVIYFCLLLYPLISVKGKLWFSQSHFTQFKQIHCLHQLSFKDFILFCDGRTLHQNDDWLGEHFLGTTIEGVWYYHQHGTKLKKSGKLQRRRGGPGNRGLNRIINWVFVK